MEKYCPKCNKYYGETDKNFCTIDGTDLVTKTPSQALSDEISVIKNKIVWNVPTGEVAYRVSEKEMDSLLNVTGIVVDESVTAYIYINGKLASEIHGGNYDFISKEELERKLNARFGGIADKLKNVWKVITRFWVGTSLNEQIQQNHGGIEKITNMDDLVTAVRQDAICSVVLKIDRDFPLVFEQNIQTSNYNGTVGLNISVKITDFSRFFQCFLLGGHKKSVTNLHVRDALKHIVTESLVNESFVKGIVTEENKEHVRRKLQTRIEQANIGISFVQINDCCIDSEDLNRLMALDREIYLSDEEIDRLHRMNVIKNRLNNVEVQQQIEEARGQLNIVRILNAINRDKIATDEEMQAFVETIANARKLRIVQNQEDFNEAVAKIRKARILREEDINILVYEASTRQYKRETEFSLMQLRDSIERSRMEQSASQESESSAVAHQIGLERIKDAYKKERFQMEIEQRNKLYEQQFREQKGNIELLAGMQSIDEKKKMADHQRQMEVLKTLTGHDINVLTIKSTMTAEQLTAEQLAKLNPEAQKAYFESIAAKTQIQVEKEKADFMERIMDRTLERNERMARYAMDTASSSSEREKQRADEYKENLYRTQNRIDRQQEQTMRYTVGNPQAAHNVSNPVPAVPQASVVPPLLSRGISSNVVKCPECGKENDLSEGAFCAYCKAKL